MKPTALITDDKWDSFQSLYDQQHYHAVTDGIVWKALDKSSKSPSFSFQLAMTWGCVMQTLMTQKYTLEQIAFDSFPLAKKILDVDFFKREHIKKARMIITETWKHGTDFAAHYDKAADKYRNRFNIQ